MRQADGKGNDLLRNYVTGLVLALILTIIPFAIAATGVLPHVQALGVVLVAAVAQILVHFRYFLHLDLTTTPRENILVLAFAAVLILIMLGGSFWIMFDLHERMGM